MHYGRWQSVRNTGNSVANYSTRECYCERCGGTGGVDAARAELSDHFLAHQGNLTFRGMMDIYRRWKKTGDIPCDECEGRGQWEEWS